MVFGSPHSWATGLELRSLQTEGQAQAASWCNGEVAELAQLSVPSVPVFSFIPSPHLCLPVFHLRVQPLSSLSFQWYPSFPCSHQSPPHIFSLSCPLNLLQGTFSSSSWQLVVDSLGKVSSPDVCGGDSGEIDCADWGERLVWQKTQELWGLCHPPGVMGPFILRHCHTPGYHFE